MVGTPLLISGDRFCVRWQAKYVDPEKALEAKERGNDHFRAGQWALAISEYEEVSVCDSSFETV